MASAVVKVAVVCLMILAVGQLMASAVARPDHDAAMLRLELEVEEQALAVAEELALLDDGAGDAAVGACSCDTKCKTCLAKCGVKCIPKGITGFPTCFFTCVFTTNKCFG